MTEMIEALVPDIGSISNVPIIEIAVQVGDTIGAGDTLIVLESDKATLDVPADTGGRVVQIKVAVGEAVSKGSLVALIEAEAPQPPMTEKPVATAPLASPNEIPKVAGAAAAARSTVTPRQTGASSDTAPSSANSSPAHASPAIRKLARELGLAISEITGSGIHNRITRDDLMRHARQRLSADAARSSPTGLFDDLPPWPDVDFARFGPIERMPLSRIRRISGPNLTRNAMLIPHVTNFEEADITDLEAFRKAANAEAPEALKMTFLAFVVKACVAALKLHPAFNASLDGQEVVLKKYYHIGIAADTPEGLLVPVIRDADTKGLRDIAAEIATLAEQARARKLPPEVMQGASFTISSLGGVGGTNFTPIINAPEVAILGLSRAAIRPNWDGEAFRPRLMQPLSLTWDHRVVDGAAAARFLVMLAVFLSDFRRISL